LDAGDRFSFHHLQPFKTASVGDAQVTPLPASHDPSETCLLFYIEKDGKKLFYGNDTGWLPYETWDWLKSRKIDMAILDCTCGYTGNNRNPNHMSIETVLEVQRVWREDGVIDGGSKLYVTHFTHNSRMQHEDFVSACEPFGIGVAYDGLIVNV